MSREAIIKRLDEDQRQWVEDLFRENEGLRARVDALAAALREIAKGVEGRGLDGAYEWEKAIYDSAISALAAVGVPPEQTGCALKGCLGLDKNGVCPNGYGGTCEAIFLEPSNMDEDPLAVPPEQTP